MSKVALPAAVALVLAGSALVLSPPAQAAVVVSLTGDMGCSPSTLAGRSTRVR